MSDIGLKIYFDFACPFVYNAAVWLDMVKKNSDQKIDIEWRHFLYNKMHLMHKI